MMWLWIYCAFAYGFVLAILMDCMEEFESENMSDALFAWCGAFICWMFSPIILPISWTYNTIQVIKNKNRV